MNKTPFDPDVEAAVIGCLLLDLDSLTAFSTCEERGITKDSFYNTKCQMMWQALSAMGKSGQKMDTLVLQRTLIEQKNAEHVDWREYARVDTITNLEKWIDILKSLEARRNLIDILSKGLNSAQDESLDISETVSKLDKSLMSNQVMSNQNTTLMASQISEKYKDIIKLIQQGQPMPKGIMTKFPSFDDMLGGLKPNTMIVIGARPSSGKTSLATNIVENIINHNKDKNILFLSLEMDDWSIYEKILCGMSKVSASRIHDGLTTHAERLEIDRCMDIINKSGIGINDKSDLTVSQIRAVARQMHMRKPIDLIVLDYIQFCKASDNTQTREQQVSEISRNLKGMSKELRCPVIVLSQLSRDSDKADRRPRISDLRDSGAIEQDADVVAMIWPNNDQGYVELLVAKNRKGKTGMVKLNFDSSTTKFTELAPNAEPARKSYGGEE